jgi:predicted Zn-dependent protease
MNSWMRAGRAGVLSLGALAGGLALSAVATGCTTNPTTGRSQFNALSLQEEIAIGTQGKPEMIREYGGEVARAELRQYVAEVGMRLVETTAQDDPTLLELPWEFTLLNSDVVNAFALPGGKVFMSRGLAQMMSNEAQLAGVLGHEIGHVTARHVNDRYARQMGAQIGVGLLGVLLGGTTGGGDLANIAGNVAQLSLVSYDRAQEIESDALGMRYMARAGYNPAGQKQVMQLLAGLAKGQARNDITSTHPHPEERIEVIERALQSEYASTQNNPEFQLGEDRFRQRFLSKLTLAYPDAGASRLARTRDELGPIGACSYVYGHAIGYGCVCKGCGQ